DRTQLRSERGIVTRARDLVEMQTEVVVAAIEPAAPDEAIRQREMPDANAREDARQIGPHPLAPHVLLLQAADCAADARQQRPLLPRGEPRPELGPGGHCLRGLTLGERRSVL